MKLKSMLVALLSFTSAFGWSQPEARPQQVERPPRYPDPGRPNPSPRPEPRPPGNRPPTPRPEPRPPEYRPPTPRPEPRPPAPRPEPRPPTTPRPEPRPPRPEPRPPVPRPEPRPPRPTPIPRPPDRPPAPRPPRPYPTPMFDYVTISVNRTFYNYETLRLNDYINLYSYYGYTVESVEIDAYAYDATQRLSLVVDGQIDADTYILGYDSFARIYPRSYVRLGYNTYDLGLLVRGNGSVRINRIVLRLSR